MTAPQAIVYKLYDVDDPTQFYVGSTNYGKRARLSTHKCNCVGDVKNPLLYQYFQRVGVNNMMMETLESMTFTTKEALLWRERHWYDELRPPLNAQRPILSEDERYADLQAKRARYYAKKKDDVEFRAKRLEYSREHAEERKDAAAVYYKDHKQQFLDRLARIVECETCGKSMRYGSLSEHRKKMHPQPL